jgi:hypothetical protein
MSILDLFCAHGSVELPGDRVCSNAADIELGFQRLRPRVKEQRPSSGFRKGSAASMKFARSFINRKLKNPQLQEFEDLRNLRTHCNKQQLRHGDKWLRFFPNVKVFSRIGPPAMMYYALHLEHDLLRDVLHFVFLRFWNRSPDLALQKNITNTSMCSTCTKTHRKTRWKPLHVNQCDVVVMN